MAISRDDLINKVNDWRKDKNINLSSDFFEYLDDYVASKDISIFAVDSDTGEELGDYTPEYTALRAEVLNDLGISYNEIDEIMNNSTFR